MIMRVLAVAAVLAIVGGWWVWSRAAKAEARAAELWPASGSFVEVDGTPVHYKQMGQGPDVVLLHGAGGNLRDYSFSLMGKLAETYRVTAFDRPALGYTGRPVSSVTGLFSPAAESPGTQAALLARAAEQLGIEAPLVVGHSFGGAVAMAWGLDQPSSGLVILGGAVMPWPGELGVRYRLLGSGLGGAIVPPFATAFMDPLETGAAIAGIFAPQDAPAGYLDHVGPGLALRRETIRANSRQVNTLRPHLVEMSARYGDLTIPVEFVHGDADDTVPLHTHAQRAAPLIDGAVLTVLEGVGHMPHHAREGAVIEAIRRVSARAERN